LPRLGGKPLFDPWPITREPGLDQGVIPFTSLHCWMLRTPAEGCEAASQIMGLVLDAKFDQYQGTNPAERPPIRVKAGLQRSPTQHLQQVLPRVCGQARRTSRHSSVPQTLQLSLAAPKLHSPRADRRPTDAHLAGDGRVGEVTSWPQPPGFQTAFLTWRAGELSWSPSHGHRL